MNIILLKRLSPLMLAMILTSACQENETPGVFNPNKPGEETEEPGLNGHSALFVATPTSSPTLFDKVDQFSSEFDANDPLSHWDIVEEKYQSWIFKPQGLKLNDGMLEIVVNKMETSEPGKNGTPCYFSSGMLRSKIPVSGYGYYEARIKGADVWQGVCPSFWLYTMAAGPNQTYTSGEITYNEIDVIEIQQIPSNKYMMCSNLHMGVAEGNPPKSVTKKAGKYNKMGKNEFVVDYDHDSDFHVYACEVRPDSVVFYIDDVRTASKPNYFHHMQDRMFLTLSMGIRTPFEYYNDAGQRIAVDPENPLDKNGNPIDMSELSKKGDEPWDFEETVMYVDHIRTYTRKDGYDKFRKNQREWNENEFKNQE